MSFYAPIHRLDLYPRLNTSEHPRLKRLFTSQVRQGVSLWTLKLAFPPHTFRRCQWIERRAILSFSGISTASTTEQIGRDIDTFEPISFSESATAGYRTRFMSWWTYHCHLGLHRPSAISSSATSATHITGGCGCTSRMSRIGPFTNWTILT